MTGDVLRDCLSMGRNLGDMTVLAIFLATMVTLAAAGSALLLTTFCMMCVVAGVLLGHAAVDSAGLHYSTGAGFVATAILGLAILHHLHGRKEAYRAINTILFALVIIFGALFLLSWSKPLSSSLDASIRKAGLRFISIYLVQSLVIYLLDRPSLTPSMIRIPTIVMMAEILEGSMFYPCALLGDRMPISIIEYTISSIGIRLMTTLLAVPFLLVFPVLQRKEMVARWAQMTLWTALASHTAVLAAVKLYGRTGRNPRRSLSCASI